MMGDYRRLQTETEAEFSVTNDFPNDVYRSPPMSARRKAAFVASIVFCILVIWIFVWGLPCQMNECNNSQNSISWVKTLNGLELKGRMHLIGGTLVAMFRSARWGSQLQSGLPPSGGGVIALAGRTGEEVYWILMKNLPKYIDCSLLGYGTSHSCVVVGEGGYLAALDPVSGLLNWVVNSDGKSSPKPVDIDVPLLVPDQNGDGRDDLATLSRYSGGHHRIALISSSNGTIIKQPLLSADCEHVNNLTYDPSRGSLLYTCYNQIASHVLEYNLGKKSTMQSILIPDEERARFSIDTGSSGEHKIIVNNSGNCPDNCFISVNVTDQSNRTIWSYHRDRTYVMSPVPLRFKHSISGFLLKLWHWHSPQRKVKSFDGLTVELITERTVLITFNKSDINHVANTSQTDIVQLCYDNECQPHVSFQTQSALIADLNGDGAQDLISYFVTYRTNNMDPLSATNRSSVSDWTLESRIKVVRLEADLPKLYDAVSKH